jgi:hypothetical protein
MYKDENFTVDEITDIVIRVMEKYKRRRTRATLKYDTIRFQNKRTSHKYKYCKNKGGMDINNGNNIRRTESEGTEEELGEFTQPQRETLQPHHRIHVDTVLPTPRQYKTPKRIERLGIIFGKTARNNPTNDMTI